MSEENKLDDQTLDRTAIVDEGEVMTYRQLRDFSECFGTQTGERKIVMIIASNTMESIAGYVACLMNHCVVLLVRQGLDTRTLLDYITQYRVNAIWSEEDDFLEAHYRSIFPFKKYRLYPASNETAKLHPELALLLTTSGSTGSKKMVRISYSNLKSNTESIVEYLGIRKENCAITSLPMYYTYGLSVINTHLYQRATIVATKTAFYQQEFWRLFQTYRINSFAGVPYAYEVLRKIGFLNRELPDLRDLTVAGGKLSGEEEEVYLKYAALRHKRLIIMYGQTEATARMSYRPYEMAERKKGSIGIPVPGGRMWLADSFGKKITGSRIEGEIVYKGANVAMGYAEGAEDLSAGYDWGDRLLTGDKGYQDEDGYFYLTGRKDRMVKINGIRVDLSDLEKLLAARFPEICFRCEVEKCLEKTFFKRIVVTIRTGTEKKKTEQTEKTDFYSPDLNGNSGILDENTILKYIVEKTCFGEKLIRIRHLRPESQLTESGKY